MIANCGKDENGRYIGGQAGDQSKKEWHVISWYNRPWNCVIRHPKAAIRKDIAAMAEAGAKNDNIGYDQGQRLTFYEALKKANYKVNGIKTKCEADCSSGVMSIVKAVGHRKKDSKLKEVPITTTHYMRKELKEAGFEILTDSKYLTSDAYLLPGDILLNDGAHTAINLTEGSKAVTKKEETKKTETKKTETKKEETKKPETKKVTHIKVKTNGGLLRCRKGTSTSSAVVGLFKNGTKLELVEKTKADWYKVTGKSTTGKTISGYVYTKYTQEV